MKSLPNWPLQQTVRRWRAQSRRATVGGRLLSAYLVRRSCTVWVAASSLAVVLFGVSACSKGANPQQDALRAADASRGEYRLHVISTDPIFSALPSTMRLDNGASVAAGQWQALPATLPDGHLFSKVAVWKQDPDGSITLDWNNNHSGIQIVLKPDPAEPGSWSGRATTYWDVTPAHAPMQWPAYMERIGD